MRDDIDQSNSSADDDRIIEGLAAFDVSAGRARHRDPVASFNTMYSALERRERSFHSSVTRRGRRGARGRGWLMPSAIAVAVVAIGIWAVRRPSSIPAQQREYATGADERATIQLGDGSRIILGPGTHLRYAQPFGVRDRNVYLDGKAYFTVAPKPSLPFVVYTATSATQVLGTSFVVKAMPRDSVVQVVVASGKVVLRQRDSHLGTGTTLTHGELGRLNAAGVMTVSQGVDATAWSSWSQDRLVFTQTPAATVIQALEERYDLQVVLPPHFDASTPVSFAIDVENGDQATQLLASTLRFSATRDGRVVTLRPIR